MIDTVIISIPKDKTFAVVHPGEAKSVWHRQTSRDSYAKFIKKPTKEDLESGHYFPKITGINRTKNGKIEASIRAEFSIPKLLFMNNVDEAEEKDFGLVIQILKERFFTMGLVVTEQTLRMASVSAVHYSKNILLTEGYTSQFVISELNKIDLKKYLDFSKTKFTNDGQGIYMYSVAHSFVIYDKVADIKKPSKRAFDKDPTRHQRTLFDEIQERKDLYEVLRLEIRLSQKKKMNYLFTQLKIKPHPTLEEVFCEKTSKAVIHHYWETLVKNNSATLFSPSLSPKETLKQVFIANPKLGPKQALYFASLLIMSQDSNGIRELRSILDKYSVSNWSRTKKDIDVATNLLKNLRPRDWFDQIEKAINEFTPFKARPP